MGDLTADVYVDQKKAQLGGAALNGAMWAKRLDVSISVLSAVGDDDNGKKFCEKLQKENFDEMYVEKLSGRTSSIDIFLNSKGEKSYGIWKPGILRSYHLSSRFCKQIRKFDALAVTLYPYYAHLIHELGAVKPAAGMHKKPFIVFNLGDLRKFERDTSIVYNVLPRADMLVFGLDKDEDESRINAIRDIVPKRTLLVITLGAYGSIAYYKGVSYVQPAGQVQVVDTTGAGDAFLAGFLASYLQTKDIQKSLQSGADLASRAVQRIGAY